MIADIVSSGNDLSIIKRGLTYFKNIKKSEREGWHLIKPDYKVKFSFFYQVVKRSHE